MMVVLDFFLLGFNQIPGRGGINPDLGVTKFVKHLTGNVVIYDDNNNEQYVSAIQGYVNNILARGRDRMRRREFRLCRVNQ